MESTTAAADRLETTIVNTMHKHVRGQPWTIGIPTPNNSVYILDDDLRPVSVSEISTMWGGGRGISRGYMNLLRSPPRDTCPTSLPPMGKLSRQLSLKGEPRGGI